MQLISIKVVSAYLSIRLAVISGSTAVVFWCFSPSSEYAALQGKTKARTVFGFLVSFMSLHLRIPLASRYIHQTFQDGGSLCYNSLYSL